MGTHYHDQPPEQWADAVSLDPTPVWKQYIVVALLLVVSLVLIAVISVPALLPSVVAPPAVVPGGRVVLPLAAMPAVGELPRLIGPPLVDRAHAFFIAQPAKSDFVAVLAHWSPREGGPACDIDVIPPFSLPGVGYFAECPATYVFGVRGEPITAPRSLARYLVAVDRDRLIVNISREIREYGATPQPRVAPLATP